MSRRIMPGLLLLALLAIFALMILTDRTFGAPGPDRAYVLRLTLPSLEREVGLPRIDGPNDASRPLVVLDPGHGGHDPGAGTGDIKEKALTLRLAQALRDELVRGGGVRVALTRDEDRFLMLAERSEIARRLKADLFLSIHADSAAAEGARGASVYVLSERGSSDEAARIAARENKVDTLNGVALSDRSDTVNAILVDLSQREALSGSSEAARLILRELRGKLLLRAEGKVQSAAFVVLKTPDMPSALFEAGYISNPDDQALLSSDDGQKTFAAATARAIRAYFARRSGASPSP